MVCAAFTPAAPRTTQQRVQNRARRRCACAAQSAAPSTAHYDRVLLAVVDSNPYLSADTRAAVAVACKHVSPTGALTVLFADAKPVESSSQSVRLDTLRFHLNENGFSGEPSFLSEAGQNMAAAISDAADSSDSALVVLSCGAVHAKAVEVHLLCEFLSAPLLLVP